MCKFISSDSIIGNFVIESLEKNKYKIEFEKLYDFDELLSKSLKSYDYYTKFDLIKVFDFKEQYPFLIESLENECLNIARDIDIKIFQATLIRYFRLGMPKIVISEMKSVSQMILG